MRVIGRNELTINDPFSGSELVVYYNLPSTSRRIELSSQISGAEEGTPLLPIFVALGRDLIAGYPQGQFGIDDPLTGETVAVDSEYASSNYNKDWKELIFSENSGNDDILGVLGRWVVECFNVRRVGAAGDGKKKE